MTPPRPLPGFPRVCPTCGQRFVFARTLASPTGRGGKAMPLDVLPNPAGNVAVREVSPGVLVCRVLGKDDTIDRSVETLAMPHFATCTPKLPNTEPEQVQSNVIPFRPRKARP